MEHKDHPVTTAKAKVAPAVMLAMSQIACGAREPRTPAPIPAPPNPICRRLTRPTSASHEPADEVPLAPYFRSALISS